MPPFGVLAIVLGLKMPDTPIAKLKVRRQKLADLMPVNSAALILSAQQMHRNSDVEHKFRQNSSFWYLTGFNEPDSALLIIKTEKETVNYIFARPKEKEKEIWTGYRSGPAGAAEIGGIEQSFLFSELKPQLEKLLGGLQHIYFDFGSENYISLGIEILDLVRQKRIYQITSTQNLLGELRLFKDDWEIAQIKVATQIAAKAHNLAREACKAGEYEYYLEGLMEGFFRQNNCNWAYPSIVAAGQNATILHYTNNNGILKDQELILIDAGCEYNYYAADITRTFPVNGKFTTAQKEIYDLVLKAELAAIEQSKIKNATFDQIHEKAVWILSNGLKDLKLLTGSFDEILEEKKYRKFYMHRTGHWLGLDVHDIGAYQESDGKSKVLKPGMLMTIEPGLYFDPENSSINEAFRGIGIRIEDDILITEIGCENLTELAIK